MEFQKYSKIKKELKKLFSRHRCHEAAFNVLATPIRTAKQLGYHFDSRILDIENVDLATGKMMDQVNKLISFDF